MKDSEMLHLKKKSVQSWRKETKGRTKNAGGGHHLIIPGEEECSKSHLSARVNIAEEERLRAEPRRDVSAHNSQLVISTQFVCVCV